RWCVVSAVIFRFFFSSRRRHTRFSRDWSSDVCSSDLISATTVRFPFPAKSPKFSRKPYAEPSPSWPTILKTVSAKANLLSAFRRSEERRVGKESRAGVVPSHYKQQYDC